MSLQQGKEMMAARKKPMMEKEPTTKAGMKKDMAKDKKAMASMPMGKMGPSKKPLMYD